MADTPMRRWCAVIRYPGKLPVTFGTAFVPHGAPMADVEAELRRCIGACLPDGWKLENMLPGAVWFQPETN